MENFNPFQVNLEPVNITRLDEVSIKKEFEDGTFIVETDVLLEIQYKTNRMQEYPSIGDQLDALFHAGVFPEEMATQIQAIKDKYPKPE